MFAEKLVLGSRIIVIDNIDLAPYGLVQKGETGTVTAVYSDEAEVTLDRFHAEIVAYCGANVLWIIAGCVDVLEKISLLIGTS